MSSDLIESIVKGKVVMAPLAGFTNLAYRKICKEFGASLVYSEMVSAKGLIYDNKETLEYLKTEKKEHPLAIQLFGGNTSEMVRAAKIVFENNCCDILDINMGCPVKKVLKQEAGSFLLQYPDRIYEMVKAICSISPVPVSCKIRAGWDHNSINCVEVSKRIEEAGASLIAIHGRTKSDLYRGKCNLDYIKMVKESVSIPVIGNGDIKTLEDAINMINYTKCDAIMIGRGALGNPWLIKEISSYFKGIEYKNNVSVKDKKDMIKYHYFELKKLKGEYIALLEMRTMASYYVKSIPNSKQFKLALNNIKKEEEFLSLVDTLIGDYEN